jgi:hypothetical protein
VRIEYFDDDGSCFVTIFSRPHAEPRARAYHEALRTGLLASHAPPTGRVIEFNYLEVDIERLIARILKQDDMVAATFAVQLNFGAKLKLAETLIPLKVGFALDLQKRASDVVSDARTVNAERNSFIHSEYLPFLDANDNLLEVLKKKIRDSAKVLNATNGEAIDGSMGRARRHQGAFSNGLSEVKGTSWFINRALATIVPHDATPL